MALLQASTVLVTGGTGFTGSVLVKRLIRQNAKVRVIARPTSNLTSFRNLPIEWITGDVFDKDVVSKAVNGVGEVFICGNERPIALKELVSIVAAELNVKVRFIPIPKYLLLFLTSLSESFFRLIHVKPVLYHRRIGFLFKDRFFDASKMRRVLGFTPRYTLCPLS
jgi:nucleoside-diphosphate-sugar epimerase